MAAPKGHARYGGRIKGTPNKFSVRVKDEILEAYAKLGGVAFMTEWGRKEPNAFFQLYGKLVSVGHEPDKDFAHALALLLPLKRIEDDGDGD